jgi:hypothetical protein
LTPDAEKVAAFSGRIMRQDGALAAAQAGLRRRPPDINQSSVMPKARDTGALSLRIA